MLGGGLALRVWSRVQGQLSMMPDCRPDVRMSSSLPKMRGCALRLAGDWSLHVTPPLLLQQTIVSLGDTPAQHLQQKTRNEDYSIEIITPLECLFNCICSKLRCRCVAGLLQAQYNRRPYGATCILYGRSRSGKLRLVKNHSKR